MLQTFAKNLKNVLIDWFIALIAIVLILWFFVTLPTFSIISKDDASANSSSVKIDENKLKRHVEALSYYYAPRTIEFGTLNATGSYVHSAFSEVGNPEYQPYRTLTAVYKNVLLKLGPDTEEILVIGAHYDAQNDSLDIDGNASGVATLIELARLLANNEDKLSIGVQLVAYPLSHKTSVSIENMGSYRHARYLNSTKKTVKLMLSLDSVGSYTDKEKSQLYPYEIMDTVYPDTGNYIGLVGRLQDYSDILKLKKSFEKNSKLPMYSFSAPSTYQTNSVDHLNYQRYGYPAMIITDTAENRLLDDKQKKGEVVNRLDYKKMAMLVEGLYQVVLDNESPQRLDRVVKNYSRNKFSHKTNQIN